MRKYIIKFGTFAENKMVSGRIKHAGYTKHVYKDHLESGAYRLGNDCGYVGGNASEGYYREACPDHEFITIDQLEIPDFTVMVLNIKHCRLVQLRLFDLGYVWRDSGCEIEKFNPDDDFDFIEVKSGLMVWAKYENFLAKRLKEI